MPSTKLMAADTKGIVSDTRPPKRMREKMHAPVESAPKILMRAERSTSPCSFTKP